MFCAIYKWVISQAKDSRKPLPAFVNRHIRRCASCREFVDLHDSLMLGSSIEGLSCLPEKNENLLAAKIISALDKDIEPRKTRVQRPVFIPVIASSLVFIVVAIGIYFLTSPRPSSSDLLNSLSAIDQTITTFEERLENINSPLYTEYEDLEQTMRSTTKFFASYLDVKIGRGSE